jgi:hypothetical protein
MSEQRQVLLRVMLKNPPVWFAVGLFIAALADRNVS